MRGKIKIKKIAHAMFTKSLVDDYPDPIRVKSVLKIATASPSIKISKILKVYKNLIKRAIESKKVVIETASPLDSTQTNALHIKTHAKKVLQKTNSKMVFGVRITHGDWVFDASLDAKLKQLTINN